MRTFLEYDGPPFLLCALVVAWAAWGALSTSAQIADVTEVDASALMTLEGPTGPDTYHGHVDYIQAADYWGPFDTLQSVKLINGEIHVRRYQPSGSHYAVVGPNTECPGTAYLDIYRACDGEIVLATTIIGTYVPMRVEPSHLEFPGGYEGR